MKFFIQSLMLFMVVHVYAQHTPTEFAAKMSSSEWIDISATKKTTAQEFVQNKSALQLTDKHSLDLISTRKSRNGYRQYRYQQTYQGVPIEGAMCIVHEKNAQAQKAKGRLAKDVDVDTQPTISEEAALQIALQNMGATRYAWEDENHEALIKKINADANATFYPKANLVIFNTNIKSNHNSERDSPLGVRGARELYQLTYRFDIYALAPMQRAMVYVDAHTGTVLAVHDQMNFADTPVTGISNYNGVVEFTADKTGNEYSYKSDLGGGIKVLNSNNTESYPPANDIIEADAFFDQDPTAVDVLWASQKTYEYLDNVHQWQELDSMPIYSWIHYGENYANAFYNGSWLTFGDGNGTTLLSPTSLDIVAHEITHAVTRTSSGLIYGGESGALNESFSDILGEIIESIYQEGGDWIAGGQLVAVPNFRGSRNLADPKDPTMLNRQPDTYQGEFWYTGLADFGGVHTNSGVQNHWFYLLAFGGSGINDNGYVYNIDSIGVEKAAQITFENLISLLPNDGYAEARAGAIASAEMLYGVGSNEAVQTEAAWCAVGVGDCYENDCSTLDSLTLVELYNAANGQNWTNKWDFNSPVVTWYGVTLNSSGCVSKIDISNNNLTADIAPEIGNLRHLKELYLNNNALTSIIPATIGNIDSLEILNLWGNIIGGALPPEIGNLTTLRILNLSFNNIVRPIPVEIADLDKLTELQLNFNPISGAIPASFGGLSSLTYLDLSYCDFTGAIPVEFGNLTNLTGLVLDNNFIVGPVPSELSDLQALNLVNLTYNKLNFGGLESLAQAGINDLRYNPQDSTYILTSGNDIYVNAGGTTANNTYAWYKDGTLVTTIIGNNHLTIDESGRYRCEVTNNIVTNPTNTETNFVLNTGEIYIDAINIFDCRTRDSLALVAMYHATNGENWLDPWDLNDPIDLWTGIILGTNGCVAVVDLMGRNLHGALPPEIGDLTYAHEFEVSVNYLTHIGPEIGNLTNLTHLQLNTNNFNQNIPIEIGNLTNLIYLNTSNNYFHGEVPSTFSNLNNLNELVLHDCRLSGTIPAIPNLNYLYIENNKFDYDALEYWAQEGLVSFNYSPQGHIPIYKNANILSIEAGGTLANNFYIWYKDEQAIDTTYGVAQLTISEPGYYYCDVYNNIANETILLSESTEVFSVSDLPCRERDSLALVEIYQATNGADWTNTWDLTQPMNTWYGIELSNTGCVDKLDLRENNLNGTLATAIGDLTEMTVLYLQSNQIGGNIPYQIGNLTNLEIIDLGDNNLSGEIPNAMSNMRGIKELSLYWNELSGTVPNSFWSKADLEVIRLFRNDLTGTLPPTIGQLVNVRHFSIGNNDFTGTIPPEIGQMINLKRLSIYDCHITGNIPTEIAKLFQLTELVLHENELTGAIPPELGQLENLLEVRLNKNKLSGAIPFDINQLSELWIDRNNFTFDQIEDWISTGANESLDLFRYAPQAKIPLHTNGDTLFVDAGGTIANNTYHWYKDGVFQQTIQGDHRYLPTSAGSYYCKITNAIATDETIFYTRLILETETVYVQPFVWPGDFNGNGIVEISDILFWGFAYGNQGPARQNASAIWEAQMASQWDLSVSEANGKHQDADGNGEVNEQDLQVFNNNFAKTRPNATTTSNNAESPYVLSMREISTTPTDDGKIERKYGVYLTTTNGLPVSVHGIDFTLVFGTSGNLNPDISVNAENSFLAPDELVVIPNDDNTEFRIAATRTDGNNRIGGGGILQVVVILDDITADEPILHVLEPRDIEVMTINTGHEGGEAQLIPVSGEIFYASPIECNTPSCDDDEDTTTYYFITNRETGDRFYPESTAHNAPLRKAYQGRNDALVQWEKIPTTDGYFYLKNKATGKFIRPENDDDAATVWQVPTTFTGSYTQWTEVPVAGGFYHLKNRATGKYIRPLNDTPDAPILQQPSTWTGTWTQWTIEAVNAPRQQSEDITFNLYPNPAEDYIHIDIQNTWENGTISIYDISGKLLIEQVITSDTHDISVENLNAGMYILRLETNDGTATKRFIVK